MRASLGGTLGILGLLGLLASTPACWRTNVYAVTGGSAGCGKTSAISFEPVPNQDPDAGAGSGFTVGHGEGGYVTIEVSGKPRSFTMRIPDNYDPSQPYWLSFTFHPGYGNSWGIDNGGTNGYLMAYYGLQKLSDNGAFFVAPDGLNGVWANVNGEDVTFVDAIVGLIENNYCIDKTHIFAQGFAAGGGMAFALACARADVFRAVAIYEGAITSSCDNGSDPVGYWQMVGLEDTIFPVEGAQTMRDQFAANNGCTIPASDPPAPPAPPPYLNPGGHVCTDYAGCSSGHPLRWCVHQSGLGNAIVDGTGDLYDSCGTYPDTCSPACPCTWVPQDVWAWMNGQTSTGQTPNLTSE